MAEETRLSRTLAYFLPEIVLIGLGIGALAGAWYEFTDCACPFSDLEKIAGKGIAGAVLGSIVAFCPQFIALGCYHLWVSSISGILKPCVDKAKNEFKVKVNNLPDNFAIGVDAGLCCGLILTFPLFMVILLRFT